MKLTRRSLLKGIMGLPVVAVLGTELPHEHQWREIPTRLGYNCECGMAKSDDVEWPEVEKIDGLHPAAHALRERDNRVRRYYYVTWDPETGEPRAKVIDGGIL